MPQTARKSLAVPRTRDLKVCLEDRLTHHFGKRRAIVKMARRLCPYTSSFRIEELDVSLDDGTELSLVLKDLSREAMLHEARRARPRFLHQPSREIQAYRWI